jgi:hypothetical protein
MNRCGDCGRILDPNSTCGCQDKSGVAVPIMIDVSGNVTYGQGQKIIELLGEILNELEQIRYEVRGFR